MMLKTLSPVVPDTPRLRLSGSLGEAASGAPTSRWRAAGNLALDVVKWGEQLLGIGAKATRAVEAGSGGVEVEGEPPVGQSTSTWEAFLPEAEQRLSHAKAAYGDFGFQMSHELLGWVENP